VDRRVRGWSLTKSILVFGVIYFTAFAVVGITFRRFDVSDDTLSIVGAVMAYAFLATVGVLAFARWQRNRRTNRTS
jgi:hypothetical protein